MALIDGKMVYAAAVAGRTFDDLPALLAVTDGDLTRLSRGAALGSVEQARWLAPIARPRKIIGIGLNYHAHAAEFGLPPPSEPPLFPKWDNALAGSTDDVPLPAASNGIDYEAELAFLFSRRCRNVAAVDAAGVLLGFTAANDVSARDFQFKTGQWAAGKVFDGFCPLGPWIVTVDELGPSPDLQIRGRLNGELCQDSRTSDLIFSVPDLVAYISKLMTMEAGDLVLTGTPSGVGNSKKPPRFLQPGDEYAVEIERIGTLRNRFVAA